VQVHEDEVEGVRAAACGDVVERLLAVARLRHARVAHARQDAAGHLRRRACASPHAEKSKK